MKKDSITVVLVTETRQPMTLEFSVKELVLVVVLLLSLIFACIYSIVDLKNIRSRQSRLSSTITDLNSELSNKKDSIQLLKIELDQRKSLVLMIDQKGDTLNLDNLSGLTDEKVSVQELKTDSDNKTLNLSFRLLNNDVNQIPVDGYLIIIAEHKSNKYALYSSFPQLEFSASSPLNYRDGDSFSIRNFKPLDISIQLKDDAQNYERVKFYAFDQDGEILMSRSFPLN